MATRRATAGFPTGKTFQAWSPEASSIPAPTQQALRTLEWVHRRENLVVCGPSGTGKTFLLEALGQHADEQGLRVAWFTLEDLGVMLPVPDPTFTDQAAEPVEAGPRASFGEVDCGDLSVVLTPDNSRSSEPATYLTNFRVDGDPFEAVLSAGEVRSVLLRLPAGAESLTVNGPSGSSVLAETSTRQCTKPEIGQAYDPGVTVSATSVPLGGTLTVTAFCQPETVEAQVVLSTGTGLDGVVHAEATLTSLVDGFVEAELPVFANGDFPPPTPGPGTVEVFCYVNAGQGPLGYGFVEVTITAAQEGAEEPVTPPVNDTQSRAE